MIEQLQKIAEDAGVDARTMGFESNQHHRDPWNARLEKFAELLIRECVTKMALEIMDEQWVDDAVKNTYTHFGVKE